jgi:peptidoglycan/LPS O-acetylase OafA/YrhL
MISERSLYLHFLRFFSAAVVCLGHTKEFLFVHMDESALLAEKVSRLFLGLGPSAVLVFFFLSGYLVGGNEMVNFIGKKLNFSHYIFNRLTRLWIVLLPALLATFAFNSFTCRNSRDSLYCMADSALASHAEIPPQFSQELSDLVSNVFFLQPFMGTQWGGNGPLWSLSYEFWYYMVFFSIISVISYLLKREIGFGLISHLLLLFVASRILDLDWLILGIIWLSGALVAYFLNRDSFVTFTRKYQKPIALKFTLLTITFILPALISLRLFPRIFSFPIAILLLTISLSLTQNENAIKSEGRLQKTIVRGSEYSFSLYLTHFPLIALATSLFVPVDRWRMSPFGIFVLILLTLGALVTAYGFAWLTEFNLAQVRIALRSRVQRLLT